MKAVGSTLTKYVTAPALGVGVAAGKLALDFDKSMTLVQTQAGASRKEVKRLSKEILDFAASGKTQFSPNELAQALYSIESAGIHGSKAMKTLKASSQLATVGQSNLADTTKALAAAQKTGIRGSGNLKNAIGILNATVGAGQMHMEDLVSAMGTGFLSTAAQAGVSLKDLGTALDELTKQGQPATQAATHLRMTLSLMAAPSSTAKTALQSIGLSSTDLATAMQDPKKGLLGAIQMLHDHLSSLSKVQQTQVLTQAFGGGKSSAAIIALVNHTGDLNKNLHSIDKNAGTVHDKFKEMQKDPEVRLQRVWSQVQAVLIKMGNKLLPKIIPLIKRVATVASHIIDAFTKAPGWVQDFLIGAIVVGPVLKLAGAFASIAGSALKIGRAGLGKIFGSAGGVLGTAEGTRGATPANPLFVEVVNGGVGGGSTSKSGGGGGFLGAGIVTALAAFGFDQASHLPSTNPATKNVSTSGKDLGIPSSFSRTQQGLGGSLGALKDFFSGGSVPTTLINVLGAMQDKFGSLQAAAHHMSKGAKEDFLRLAAQAVQSGNLSGGSFDKLDRIFGTFTNHATTHFHEFGTAGHKSSQDIHKWSSDAVGAFNQVERQNAAFAQGAQGNFHQFGTAGHKSASDIKQWANSVTGYVGTVMDKNKNLVDNAGNTAHNVGQSYQNLLHAAGIGMSKLGGMTNAALRQLGLNKTVTFRTKGNVPVPGTHAIGSQKGGRIVPGVGSGDKVPAMLEPGEFVLNREAVKGIGQARLESLNKAIPRFKKGGMVFPLQGNYSWGRTDMGVDFGGTAQIAAMGDAVVSSVGAPGWPGGGGVLYKLLAGAPGVSPSSPYIYNYEHVSSRVKPGQKVKAGQVIGSLLAGFPGLEIGFGTGSPGGALAAPHYSEGDVTPEGRAMLQLLKGLSHGKFFGGSSFQKIKRVLLQGPKGPLLDMGQSVLDKTRNAANAMLRKKASHGIGNVKVPGGDLSKAQLVSLWNKTGSGGDANTMAAIALAESGGNPSAINSIGAKGLWQILPSTASAFGLNYGQLFNPVANAEGAHKVLAGQGLGAWSTYTGGQYRQYLQKGGIAMPPYGGSFAQGGVVPGPIGAPRTVVAHGGEHIGGAGRVQVDLHFANGMEWLQEYVRAEASVEYDERAGLSRQTSRMQR